MVWGAFEGLLDPFPFRLMLWVPVQQRDADRKKEINRSQFKYIQNTQENNDCRKVKREICRTHRDNSISPSGFCPSSSELLKYIS